MHRVVQDDQLGTRLDPVDRAVQEGGSAFHLQLTSHMVRLFTHLQTAKTLLLTNVQIIHQKSNSYIHLELLVLLRQRLSDAITFKSFKQLSLAN